MSDEPKKPLAHLQGKRGRPIGQPNYFDGGRRSIATLKAHKFDPIGRLVEQYRNLEAEIVYWTKVREGTVVPLTLEAKPIRYNPDAHMSAFNLLVTISEKLLRYNYGRVPETLPEAPKMTQPLIINLGQAGDTFTINEQPEDDYLEYDDSEGVGET